MVVYFMILSDIYCFLFWVGRWYLLSTCVLYWPLLVCFLFVFCGVQQTYHRLQLNRNSSRSSSRQISGWAIVPSSGWILSHSCLDVLEVRTWTISFICFSFLDILRFSNLRIDCSYGDDFQILGIMSRPKPGCDWHPHLPSYVSEPTNLTLTFQYNINRK